MQQNGSKYFARRPPPPLGGGVKKSKFTFSFFQNMVILHNYQIKGNESCSNMVANILPADPLALGWGQKVKIQLFQSIAYQIKGNRECSNRVANIFTAESPLLDPRVGSNGQHPAFSEHGHFAYHIKWNHKCSLMVANILPADPAPRPGGGVKGRNSFFLEYGHAAYQIKGTDGNRNMLANILPSYTPPIIPDPGGGVKFNFFRTWSFCISH